MDFAGVRVDPGSLLVNGIAQGAVASGFVNVMISGTVVSCLAARGLTTAAGDLVYGRRLNGRILIEGRVWPAAPDAPDDTSSPPPAPEPTIRYGQTIIAPVETRTYRLGWWVASDDTAQGEHTSVAEGNNTGCAFYGSKPRSLAGVIVTQATVRFKREIVGGSTAPQSTTLWRITQKTKPAGAPTRTGSSTSGPRLAQGATTLSITGGFHIPTSFAQDLVDGTAGGLAIYDASGDPYVRLSGRAAWSSAWRLTIQWARVT